VTNKLGTSSACKHRRLLAGFDGFAPFVFPTFILTLRTKSLGDKNELYELNAVNTFKYRPETFPTTNPPASRTMGLAFIVSPSSNDPLIRVQNAVQHHLPHLTKRFYRHITPRFAASGSWCGGHLQQVHCVFNAAQPC